MVHTEHEVPTVCNMVGDDTISEYGSSSQGDLYSSLIGSKQQVTVVACTKGTLVVTLTIKDSVFEGALLEASNRFANCFLFNPVKSPTIGIVSLSVPLTYFSTSSFRPSFLHVPKVDNIGSNDIEEHTAYLDEDENDDSMGFTCRYRYL